MPTRTQQLGLLLLLAALAVFVAWRVAERAADAARGSSPCSGRRRRARARSGWRWPDRFDGEILNCDSTAVYRGFDIGTDKVAADERQGIPHHLIDIADPTEVYTAAQYARDAARVIRDVHARGRLPILVGGTGFYYRALVAGPVSGARRRPGAAGSPRPHRRPAAARNGCIGCSRAWIPASAARIMPRDQKRMVRALEVYFATGQPLTAHFAGTRSLIADCDVTAIALRLPADADRGARRRGAWTRSSRAASWTRCARCSRAACRRTRVRSAASSTGRSWRCCAACATKRRRARSSCRRTAATRDAS